MPKSIKEIAEGVSARPFNHKTPPGKAQKVILDALQVAAESFGHANAIFEKLGIQVVPVRQGRKSVPEVSIQRESGSQRNMDGDYDTWDYSNADGLDLSPIQEWMADQGQELHLTCPSADYSE